MKVFSQNFGAESWIGVKFAQEPWYFLILEDLLNTGKCWLVTLETAKRRGLTKDELLQDSNENRKL